MKIRLVRCAALRFGSPRGFRRLSYVAAGRADIRYSSGLRHTTSSPGRGSGRGGRGSALPTFSSPSNRREEARELAAARRRRPDGSERFHIERRRPSSARSRLIRRESLDLSACPEPIGIAQDGERWRGHAPRGCVGRREGAGRGDRADDAQMKRILVPAG